MFHCIWTFSTVGGSGIANLKEAVTTVSTVTLTVQEPVPLQPPPLQPEKRKPGLGVAVRVSDVPLVLDSEQSKPQSIPVGLLVIVPLPFPAVFTVNKNVFKVKLAVTDVSAVRVTVQGPVPEQAPVHPVKTESEAGVAVRLREVPLA